MTVTAATVLTAFKAAVAGDTLKLVGAFGLTRLQDRSFSKVVTLDATNATFTDTLNLSRLDNIKVVGGKWNVAGGSTYGRAAIAYGGSNIWFDRTSVVGAAGQQGVNFYGTTNAQMSNGSFTGLQVAIGFTSVTGGLATRNKVLHAVADGIDIADSHNVTASSNACSAGNPGATVHPDCIQLWSTAGHAVQSDIIVTKNSASGMTQGFTSFSDGGGGVRIQITHNVVNTSMPQGVACYECWDSNISYNTLTTARDAAHLTNLNIIGGGRNTVVGNVVNPAPYIKRDPSWSDSETFSRDLAANIDVPLANTGSVPASDGVISAAAVPEPASWVLLIGGFSSVGLVRRRARGASGQLVIQ